MAGDLAGKAAIVTGRERDRVEACRARRWTDYHHRLSLRPARWDQPHRLRRSEGGVIFEPEEAE